MVNYSPAQLDMLFHALSDATRRAILLHAAKGGCTVTELAQPHSQSLAGISKHLKVLEQARLIEKTRKGRIITCTTNLESLAPMYDLLDQLGAFWRDRLEALETFLDQTAPLSEDNHGSRSSRKRDPKSRRTKSRAGRS